MLRVVARAGLPVGKSHNAKKILHSVVVISLHDEKKSTQVHV